MEPLIITDHYEIDYRHSYAQDSPFFVGLTEGKLMGSRCTACGYTFATPRAHCMQCGAPTAWLELPLNGRVLKETPFTLVLVEFDGANTLFLSRLKGISGDAVRVGLPVRAHFTKTPSMKVTDVWFEPA